MSFRPFFIVGLPRCRTAWCANLLTVPGQTFCWHEGEAGLASIDQLSQKLRSRREPRVGCASSALASYGDALHEFFPEARYVLIDRDRESAKKALRTAAKKVLKTDPLWPAIVQRFEDFRDSLAQHYTLNVRFEDLGNEQTVKGIWDFCTGELPWDRDRWEMLRHLNVQADVAARAAQCAKSMPLPEATPPRLKPVSSDIVPTCHEEYYAILREFLPEQAVQWIGQACKVARLWDHLIDGDPVSKNEVEVAMSALIFEWPETPFYQDHGLTLRRAMVRCVQEWRCGNSWDLCYRLPMAAAVACGNLTRYHELAPRLHRVMQQVIQEDHSWEPSPEQLQP